MAIIARALRTLADLNDPIQQGTAPANPVEGMLWLDTSKAPSPLLRWTGTEWEQVGKPSIGGTNLIPNTTGDYVQAELGQNYALLGERMEMAAMDLMPGDVVTCSMMLKNAATKASCTRVTTYSSDSGDAGKTVFTSTEVIPAGGAGKSILTMTIPIGATHLEVMIQNCTPAVTDAVTMSVKCVKLERGDTATDWSPAPEDIANRLELKLTEAYAQINTTADGIRQEVRANYAGLTDLGNVTEQLSTLSEQSEDHFTWATTRITEIGDDVAENQGLADERFELIKTYMTFGESGLIIGKSGNPVTFRVINDRVSFYMNNTEVAYLSDNKLFVTQAEILTRLKIGKFAYEPQTNGNLSMIYTG